MEMYNMLMEISSELETIKDLLAKSKFVFAGRDLVNKILSSENQNENNQPTEETDLLEVSFENLIQQVHYLIDVAKVQD